MVNEFIMIKNTERRDDHKNDDDMHSYPPLFLTGYNPCQKLQ